MLKILIVMIVVMSLAFLGMTWLNENPGIVRIDWLGYEAITEVENMIVVIAIIAFLLCFCLLLVVRLSSLPSMLIGYRRVKKQKRAWGKVRDSLAYLAAGNGRLAYKNAHHAGDLIKSSQVKYLGTMMQGDAAFLKGDYKLSYRHYEKLSKRKEAISFIGFRGMCLIEQRLGNRSKAIMHGLSAEKVLPNSAWSIEKLVELYSDSGQYEDAIDFMERGNSLRIWDKDEYSERLSSLRLELARIAFDDLRLDEARQFAEDSYSGNKFSMESALLLVSIYVRQGEFSRAEKTLGESWQNYFTQDYIYLEDGVRGGLTLKFLDCYNYFISEKLSADGVGAKPHLDVMLLKLEHAEKFLRSYCSDIVVVMYLGRLCLRAELWGKARTYLDSVDESLRDSHYYGLFAALELNQNGNSGAVEMLLQEAVTKD